LPSASNLYYTKIQTDQKSDRQRDQAENQRKISSIFKRLEQGEGTFYIRAFVADYLKEEVIAEALTHNIPAFSEFLRVAALTSSELINYLNIARETGVSHKVIRTHFDILEDTMVIAEGYL